MEFGRQPQVGFLKPAACSLQNPSAGCHGPEIYHFGKLMCVPVVLLFALFLPAVVGIFVKIPRLRKIFTGNGRQIGMVQAAGDSTARDGLELPIVSADQIGMRNPCGQRSRGRFVIRDLIHCRRGLCFAPTG